MRGGGCRGHVRIFFLWEGPDPDGSETRGMSASRTVSHFATADRA